MKKRGFTIIEVLISVFIMTLLLSLGIRLGRTVINIKNKIITNNLAYEIKDTLSLAKSYCKLVNENGRITVENNGKKMIFYLDNYGNKIMKSFNMPNGYTIHNSFGSNLWIKVSNDGYISTAGTITIKENGKEKVKVTIAVGNDLITINELDKVDVLK